MPLAMEDDEAADPEDVGLFGARAVVPDSDGFTDAVEKARGCGDDGLECGFRHDGS
jgi:hypothetical protein